MPKYTFIVEVSIPFYVEVEAGNIKEAIDTAHEASVINPEPKKGKWNISDDAEINVASSSLIEAWCEEGEISSEVEELWST